MKTLIQGGWVVGYDGRGHELLPDGVVVYEDNRIVHVGYAFDGPVDRTINARGRLIGPGLINCHIHAGTNARHVMLNDASKSDYLGMNFLSYGAMRRGAKGMGPPPRAGVEGKFGVWAAMRGGATTILDVGTRGTMIEGFTDMIGELGARAYLGAGYRSAAYVLDDQGRIQWDWNEANGEQGLAQAVEYAKKHDGAHNGRIRAMLYPGQLDTCTTELLQATKRAAGELGIGIQLHTAMNIVEFQSTLRQRGVTPIQYLHDLGFLGEEVILGHCVFHGRHSWCHYPYVDDLAMLADSGASVAHAPYKYAKMGIALESFDAYRQRGINVVLGTDTFPQDMVHEMRLAGLACRLVEGSFRAGKPYDVYNAATLGAAKALRRDDLGRLAPGAKADMILVDLRRTHFGAVRDPIKSLVEGGSGSDIETIIVDGETLLEGGRPTRFDEAELLAQIQEGARPLWDSVPEWRALGETIDDVAPMSYPVRPR
ncbi:MAG: chlorohydrolase family protein [Deltaproteobacteria bacterium]|nr:chlorohydrolase family protein [Deltaproteobacteria bacterium]